MNVHVLEIKFNFNGKEDALYPVILRTNSEVLLVDCGYSGFMPMIENAAKLHGLSLQDLTGIIITHHDIDHIGGLFEMKAAYSSLKIYSSEIEEKYISGKEKSLRLLQAENIYSSLPEDQKPGALNFQEMLKSVKPVEVDYAFSEDEEPPFFRGMKIINTPGHMLGHISIYLQKTKTLISGDALVYEEGELEIANPKFTLDLPKAIESIKKLQEFKIERIICYHGGVVEDDIQNKFSRLLSKYSKN